MKSFKEVERIDLVCEGMKYDDLEITDVDAYSAQTLVISTAFKQIAKFENGATPGMGLYDKQKIKYIRIRPTTASRTLTVQLSDATNDKQINYKLLAKETIYFTSLNFDCNSSTATASADVIQGTSNITSVGAAADEVRMMASTGASDVNIFVAYAV